MKNKTVKTKYKAYMFTEIAFVQFVGQIASSLSATSW